jgi:hypothetical protein
MATPKVHSKSLATLLETVGQKVEQFTATLDQVSADIRAVEKWLQASGIRVRVEHVYRTEEDADEEAVKAYLKALDYPGAEEPEPVPAWRHTYALAWAPESENNEWRILHISRRSEGTSPGDQWSEPHVVASRPLIETPVPVRLGIGHALERLIEEIASMVPDDAYGQERLIEGDLHTYDNSRPESGTGPWRVRFQTGKNIESTTAQRVYETWTDVLDAVARLTDAAFENLTKHLNGYSFTLQGLKVPIRVLRELKLM